MKPQDRYTYENAGFNGFLARSLKSNPAAQNVSDEISTGSGKPINIDMQQLFGGLGNKIKVGLVTINGIDGRVEVADKNTNEIGAYFGNKV